MEEATTASVGLSDPDRQPKFVVHAPNPLDPSFLFDTASINAGYLEVSVGEGVAQTGLVGPDGISVVSTPIYGYGYSDGRYTWPGRTIVAHSYQPLYVKWRNDLPLGKT